MKKYYIGRVFMAIISFSLMYIYCCDTYVFALVLTVIFAVLACKGIIGVYRAQPRPRAAVNGSAHNSARIACALTAGIYSAHR